MKGTVVSIQVGKPKVYMHDGKEWASAISKSPVEGGIYLGRLSFEGDGQGDLEHHGGLDKAVCVYCAEYYPYWEKELSLALGSAAFGENLTIAGLREEDVSIGDTFKLGGSVVQISQPRQPCWKLGHKYGRKDLPLKVQQTGYTGYYFRVLQEGLVRAGDSLELLSQSPYGVTVAYANQIMHHERDNAAGARRILEVPELSESWRTALTKRLADIK